MIRKIQSKDDERMGEIVQKSLEEAGLNLPGTAYYDPYLFHLSEHYKNEEGEYWVLEIDQVVVGGVGISNFGNRQDVCELQKLYIDDQYRGQGFSHKLIQKALAYAKNRYKYCYIETFHSLKKANNLYEKYGFKSLDKPLPETDHSACDKWLLKNFKKVKTS